MKSKQFFKQSENCCNSQYSVRNKLLATLYVKYFSEDVLLS